MKIDKHIYFTNEEYARILDYKEKNKLSFSEAVCFLSISALNSNDILDRINFLESRLDYLIKKINIILPCRNGNVNQEKVLQCQDFNGKIQLCAND